MTGAIQLKNSPLSLFNKNGKQSTNKTITTGNTGY